MQFDLVSSNCWSERRDGAKLFFQFVLFVFGGAHPIICAWAEESRREL